MGTGGKAGVHGLIGDFLVRIGGRQILLPSVDKRGEEHGAESAARTAAPNELETSGWIPTNSAFPSRSK